MADETIEEQVARVMRDHNVSGTTAIYVVDAMAKVKKRKADMAKKRAALHRIAVEEADSGSLSEDEERERSEWPR